jgi:sorting nexin-9/18/33
MPTIHCTYQPIVETHRAALSRYNDATREGFVSFDHVKTFWLSTAEFSQTDEDMAARCETVLNTTMAEMETYHSQKAEDFATMTKEHLDGEIIFYQQVN